MDASNFSIILHLLFLACLTVPSSVSQRVLYNDSCNRENRCDSRASLTCNTDNKCSCLMPETMVYDSTRLKCVSLAGEKCIYTAVGGDMSWTDEVACISHAKCVKGICECNPEFYEHSNGTCIEKRQHGEPCSKDDMCHQTLHLVCGADGTCDCNNTRLYDDTRKTCVNKAGNICSYSSNDCVENAYCNRNNHHRSYRNYHPNKCVCNSKYFKNLEGICERERNYGELCNDNTYCKSYISVDLTNGQQKEINSYLICNNGSCGCNSEKAAEDEENLTSIRICRKRLGQPCDQSDKCLENSECTYTYSGYNTCKCISTHYETENETCAAMKGYGQTCKLDKECNQRKGLLICHPSENICKCDNGKLRHPDFPERCAVSAEETESSSCNSESRNCVPNAQCQGSYNGIYSCYCVNNTVRSPNQNGYCFVRNGDFCFGDMNSPITNRTCLPGLVCQNDTCSCLHVNHQEYNEKDEKCITLINGPCSENSECTDNSECIDGNRRKVCRCKKGFTAVDRKCDLAFGESCVQGQSYPKCDRLGQLQCSVKGKCECLLDEFYDSKILKCRGLQGAKCELGKNNFCVEGAECKGFRSKDGKWGVCMCLSDIMTKEDGKCGGGLSMDIEKQS